MAKGVLPWQGLKAKTQKERYKLIMNKKIENKPEILCAGLPEEFEILLKYARELEFTEEPDYYSIEMMFKNLMECYGMSLDDKFFWEDEEK